MPHSIQQAPLSKILKKTLVYAVHTIAVNLTKFISWYVLYQYSLTKKRAASIPVFLSEPLQMKSPETFLKSPHSP